MTRPNLSAAAAALGKKGGSARSDRKTEACRRNGALAPPPPHAKAAGDWYIVRWIESSEADANRPPGPLPRAPRGPWRGMEEAYDRADRHKTELWAISTAFCACVTGKILGPYRTKREALAAR